ncbi:hypothetical protein E6C27_scaffold1468G00100 [Cucumis melo var. makuwa]|uniref:Uncharacterized protein n=1 Tax=Cucumis melo var. makuwa TaxID=1194695 RepID=A0A5A7U0B7_CUCMM|nr:hypothetical protein E6C27_scaffold1468G00100 [Cucumis melo var. makuwa]
MVRIGATKCTGQRPTKGKRRRANDDGQATMGKRRWASDDGQATMGKRRWASDDGQETMAGVGVGSMSSMIIRRLKVPTGSFLVRLLPAISTHNFLEL